MKLETLTSLFECNGVRRSGIDFVVRPPAWPLWIVLAALALAGSWLAAEALSLKEEEAAVALAESRLDARRELAAKRRKASADARREADTDPVRPLLDTIGAAWRDDVALMRLEVDPAGKRARTELKAKRLAAAFAFAERLEKAGIVANLAEHKTEPGAAGTQVAATVELRW
ncbi:hypothetical protein [Crenobacter cavernae]|uniref:Fimbrial assembly protein n=1 Tax=Crenobacter cavernae TaxID=2290923 RepID=A0ABY0FEW3_9NEIS|nr:hypothetical protein [Crenobacter cavernae]RXZ43211.1 hypothetical protein EBB06_10615 [Crenobacter cavernae]